MLNNNFSQEVIVIGSVITGTGSCVPETKLTNKMLESMVDTNDEWIVRRTGIHERNIAKGKTTFDIALEASQKALADANKTADDIDLIIACTVTPDNFTPSLSCMVQGALGAEKAAAFDLNAACSGFVYGLDTADSFIKSGKYKTVLVVCAEILSRIIDYTDRGTCILFGDGAGAVVLEHSDTEEGIIDTYLAADGKGGNVLTATALPLEESPFGIRKQLTDEERFLKMGGSEVLRFAVTAVPKAIDEILKKTGTDVSQIDWFVPHQANMRIIDNIIRNYGLEKDKVYVNLPYFGNTSSASIPLCLDEMKKKGILKKGQLAVFVGFGGGLTYGSILIRI